MTGNDILYLVIPCYNEEEVLPETARQLLAKMNSMFERGMISRSINTTVRNWTEKPD